MNYYSRHLGDYIRDTVGLSMLEDGAYNRLIDQCYQAERPLSVNKYELYRAARANTAAERKAVDYVISKFFTLSEGGYEQKRITSEIAKYVVAAPERATRTAHKAERQKRWLEERARLFAQLRERGVVPDFNTSMDDLRCMVSEGCHSPEDASCDKSQATSQTSPIPHSPIPNPQTPEEEKKTPAARVTKLALAAEEMVEGNEDLTLEQAEEYLAYRKAKRAPLTRSGWNSIVTEMRKTNRPLSASLAYAENRGWVGFEVAWLKDDRAHTQSHTPTRSDRAAANLAELDRMQAEFTGAHPHDAAHTPPPSGDIIDVDARTLG